MLQLDSLRANARKAPLLACVAILIGCSGTSSTPALQLRPALRVQGLSGSVGGHRDLYVTNLDGSVLVYSANIHRPNPPVLRTITAGLTRAFGVAVDAAGDFFVVNSQNGGSSVAEYKVGARSPFLTIRQGLDAATAVTVDAKGTLYVNSATHTATRDAIVVYAAGATRPLKTITLPVKTYQVIAGGLAFDTQGNLVVAVTLLHARGHVNTLLFQIAPGAGRAEQLRLNGVPGAAIAIDGSGNLYAAGAMSLAVFAPGDSNPSRILTLAGTPTLLTVASDGTLYVPEQVGQNNSPVIEEFAPGAPTATNTFSGPPGSSLIDAALGPQ
jgi:sugar lactone lactonase YvrE